MEELKIEALPGVGPTPEKREISLKEYNTKQIVIAQKVYQRMHDDASSGSASNNDVMEFWFDTGYNDTYKKIVRDENFLIDPKFQGEILNITPEDIIHFVDPEYRQD